MKQTLIGLIPHRFRPALRRIYKFPRRAWGALRDPLMPPEELIFVGGDSSNYKQVGESWFQTLVSVGKLKPHETVLDVGCGVGRIAVPLTRYLQSSYEGMDIHGEGIRWCRRKITRRFPRFRFRHADVINRLYNPGGKYEASGYRFPYPDDTFDFAFLTSVFTHMLEPDVENYVKEIARVLRPGGRCLATFFLLNDASLARIAGGEVKPVYDFVHDLGGGARTSLKENPELAIAYPEALVREMYEKAGLVIADTRYGGWCDAAGALHTQDFIIAVKAGGRQ